jgi:predicted lipoprotein with Yx(FWY)xxD motif
MSHRLCWEVVVVNRLRVAMAIGVTAGLIGLSGATAATAGAHRPAATGTLVKLSVTSYGKVLVGPAGRTLYDLTADGKNVSHCTASCPHIWPLLMTSGKPRAGAGVVASKLGETAAHQVTYNGRPLYYFFLDGKPGQTEGENVHSYGGAWYLVNAKGNSVK